MNEILTIAVLWFGTQICVVVGSLWVLRNVLRDTHRVRRLNERLTHAMMSKNLTEYAQMKIPLDSDAEDRHKEDVLQNEIAKEIGKSQQAISELGGAERGIPIR